MGKRIKLLQSYQLRACGVGYSGTDVGFWPIADDQEVLRNLPHTPFCSPPDLGPTQCPRSCNSCQIFGLPYTHHSPYEYVESPGLTPHWPLPDGFSSEFASRSSHSPRHAGIDTSYEWETDGDRRSSWQTSRRIPGKENHRVF